jgi:hypothetical protein
MMTVIGKRCARQQRRKSSHDLQVHHEKEEHAAQRGVHQQ